MFFVSLDLLIFEIFTFGIGLLLENIYMRKPSSLLCMLPSLPELTIVIVYCMESLINILKKIVEL